MPHTPISKRPATASSFSPQHSFAYQRTLAKAAAFRLTPSKDILFSRNKKHYFPAGETKLFAEIFQTAFGKNLENLIAFIETRKQLLGDKLKGKGTPCILFTTVRIDNQTHCLVSISGIQQYTAEALSKLNRYKRPISENVAVFWNHMDQFFQKLSNETKKSFIFLGHHSLDYDILLRQFLIATDATQSKSEDTHKTCAEKSTFNFLQKLFSKHGSNITVTGSQAYALDPDGMRPIPPCTACQENIPAVQSLFVTAQTLSPKRAQSAKEPLSPQNPNTTPKQHPGAASFFNTPVKTTPGQEKNGDNLLNTPERRKKIGPPPPALVMH